MLNDYDIQDHATLRNLLGVRLSLQLLAGDDKAALATLDQVRDLEDKPDAKLLSGLRTRAMIEARASTGQGSGAAFDQAFAKAYAASLAPLPWAIVGNRIKETKSSAENLHAGFSAGQRAGKHRTRCGQIAPIEQ